MSQRLALAMLVVVATQDPGERVMCCSRSPNLTVEIEVHREAYFSADGGRDCVTQLPFPVGVLSSSSNV